MSIVVCQRGHNNLFGIFVNCVRRSDTPQKDKRHQLTFGIHKYILLENITSTHNTMTTNQPPSIVN